MQTIEYPHNSINAAYAVKWRAFLINKKLTGRLPDVRWQKLVSEMVPGFLRGGALEAVDDPCLIPWDTPIGVFYGRIKDRGELMYFLKEQLEDEIYLRGAVQVKAGDVVLDVGGHLGTFTRIALQRGAQRVVIFEPHPVNIRCLKRTYAQEIAESRVTVVEAAAWHEESRLQFALRENEASGRGMLTKDGGLSVRAVSIDDIVKQLGLPRVDLVKMDIEGAERHALAGASAMLANFSPRMAICTYHLPDDPKVIRDLILGAQPKYQLDQASAQVYCHVP